MMSGKTEQVQTTGKNLVDMEKLKFEGNYKTVTVSGAILTVIEYNLKPNTNYAFQCVLKSQKTNMNIASSSKRYAVVDSPRRVINTESDGKFYIGFNGNNGANEIGVNYINIQLEESSSVTPYEPYTGGKPSPSPDFPQPIEVTPQGIITVDFTDGTNHQTVELNCPREFTKWDRLEKIDGVWNWVFKSRILRDFDGKGYDIQVGTAPIEGIAHFTINFKDAKKHGATTSSDIRVNKFKNVATSYAKNELGICCNWNGGIKYFSSPRNGIITDESFKAWLIENPLTIAYETEIPEHVPLPQPEQDKLNVLTMYSPNTEITNSGGCQMELTYTVDTKSYVDTKIAEISTAIVQKGI